MNHDQNDPLLDGSFSNRSSLPPHSAYEPTPKRYDNLASLLIIIGFMIVIGINFFRSLSSTALQRDAILTRQVELLQAIKKEKDAADLQELLSEYDSLSTVLDVLEDVEQ